MLRRFVVVFIILILSVIFFLNNRTHNQDLYDQTLNHNYELLLPPNAKATVPILSTTEWSRTAKWTIETDLGWQEYRRWLISQINDTYRILSATDNQISLRKTYHSEVHDLKLIADKEDGKLHVIYVLALW